MNSNNSDWVLGEILTAKHYAKTILPVRIDNSDYSDKVMLIMIPLQYVDCINKPIDIGSNEIYDSIVRHIGHPVDYKGKTYDDVDSDENDKLYSKEKEDIHFSPLYRPSFFYFHVVDQWRTSYKSFSFILYIIMQYFDFYYV